MPLEEVNNDLYFSRRTRRFIRACSCWTDIEKNGHCEGAPTLVAPERAARNAAGIHDNLSLNKKNVREHRPIAGQTTINSYLVPSKTFSCAPNMY